MLLGEWRRIVGAGILCRDLNERTTAHVLIDRPRLLWCDELDRLVNKMPL